MAKRTRGSRRDRRRSARPTSFAPPAPRPAATMPAVEAIEAVETVGDEDAEPRAAPAARLPSSAPHSPTTVRTNSALSVKAADEYRYVALDLRRIVVVLGALFAAILALWVAIDVLRIITI